MCKGVAQTRHNRGRTSAHAHTAGQTGSRFRLHWQSSRCLCKEEGSTWLRAAWRGATLLDHFGVPRAGPWRATTWLLLAPPRPPFHHSWLSARCTGFCGLPTATSLSCGIEFSTRFALRVSMPSGGKYKRCLSQTQHGSERVSRALSLWRGQGSGHRGLGRNER